MELVKKLDKGNVEDIVAVTPMQASMLFHYFSDPSSGMYFDQSCYRLKGKISADALVQAWNVVVHNNEILRTVFRWQGIRFPLQIVQKEYDLPITHYRLSNLNTIARQRDIESIRLADIQRLADITDEPFRVILCELSPDEYEMIVSTHHVLYDGWSNALMLKEVLQAYGAITNNEEPRQVRKPRYKELVRWYQRQDKEHHKKFWKNYLREYKPQTLHEEVRYRKAERPEEYSLVLEDSLVQQIQRYLRSKEITLATFIYAVWGILLYQQKGHKDTLIGVTLSGRTPDIINVESMIGLFINTLPLRITFDSEKTAGELLHDINNDLLIFKEYEGTSLLDIHDCVTSPLDGQLFDTLVVIQNYPVDKIITNEDANIQLSFVSSYYLTNFKLTLSVKNFNGLQLDFSFTKDDYRLDEIEAMGQQLASLLGWMAAGDYDEMAVSDITMLLNQRKSEGLFRIQETIHQLDSIGRINFDEIF